MKTGLTAVQQRIIARIPALFSDSAIQEQYHDHGLPAPTSTDCHNARSQLAAVLTRALAAGRNNFHFGLRGLRPYAE